MAKKVSNKKPLTVNSRSKAMNATKRVQKPNLQKKTIKSNSSPPLNGGVFLDKNDKYLLTYQNKSK